jgi:hypothetical protein
MRVSLEAADRFIALYMRLPRYAGQQREVIPQECRAVLHNIMNLEVKYGIRHSPEPIR